MSSPQPKCNVTFSEVVQKFMEIVAIMRTLRELIGQLNNLCISSFIRFIFKILFYFTPQLNPFVWADACEAALKRQKQRTAFTSNGTDESKPRGRQPLKVTDDKAEELEVPSETEAEAGSALKA